MSKVKTNWGGTEHPLNHCCSWNGCDDSLHDCIKRNKFIQDIRNKLAHKKFNKLKKES